MSIDERFMIRAEDTINIPIDYMTKEYEKDVKIIAYYICEDLEKFDTANFKIVEYSEDRLLLESDKRYWMIFIDNIVVMDGIMTIDYRVFLIRE